MGKDYPLSYKTDEHAQIANNFMHELKLTSGFPGKVIYHSSFLYKPFKLKCLKIRLKL